jgi:hypothetical protein
MTSYPMMKILGPQRRPFLPEQGEPMRRLRPSGLLGLGALLILSGCGSPEEPEGAAAVVRDAIARHGGERFERSTVTFHFRGTPYRVERNDGFFRYERRFRDSEGREIVEALSNDGASRTVDGTPALLPREILDGIERGVNSVVYFGFLPFRLDDDAVRLRDLGEAMVEGEPYHKVEVTFDAEGGGQDADDRFVYWFHREEGTLDYLAYRYHRDGGGTRFRRAVNRRDVEGILIQDWENFTGAMPVDDIAAYDVLLEENLLVPVSLVALEDVRVRLRDD